MEGREREIKLIVREDFELPTLERKSTGVASIVEEQPVDLSAVYFDTAEFGLLTQGITLRRRQGEASAPVWTLKLPVNDDATQRTEVTVNSDEPKMPEELGALLRTVLVGDDLQEVAELRTHRRRWTLYNDQGDRLAELSDDRVSVFEGAEARATFREIEIEARGADQRELKKIGRQIEKAGGEREQIAKVARALSILRVPGLPASTKIEPDDPVADAIRAAIASHTAAMISHAPSAYLGHPEGVHHMRVRQRALRSIVRAFAPMVDTARLAGPVDDLRGLGEALGEVRDLDVLEVRVRAVVDADVSYEPLLDRICVRLASSRENLRAVLSSDRYESLVRGLRNIASDDALVTANGTCREELPGVAAIAADRLRKAGRKLSPLSPESEYHEVRKLAKRARYTAQAVATFSTAKRASSLLRFSDQVTAVQRTFGDHQDASTARDRLVAIAHEEFRTDGPLSMRIGRLVEQADRDALRLRRECLRTWGRIEKELSARWPRV